MLTQEILKYFPEGHKGTIIEIGAGFPKLGNPIFGLREKGWDIISIEPNPVFCKEYESLGYKILRYACYSHDASEMDFIVTPNGLSASMLDVKGRDNVVKPDLTNGFNKDTAKGNGLSDGFDWQFFPENGQSKNIKVEALTLDTILKRHHPKLETVDAIIVDVEGFELEVFKGIRFDKLKPKLLIAENIPSNPEYYDYMLKQGYKVDQRIDINDFYIIK